MDVNYFRILFEYNRWANDKILTRSADASEADYFGDSPGLSFGNLHKTLLHSIGSEKVWLHRFASESPASITEAEAPDLKALVAIRDDTDPKLAAFVDGLKDADLHRDCTNTMPNGHTATDELWHEMAHMVNHSTQYRSEAAVRLTALGLSPGSLDMIGWLRSRPK